MNAKKPQRKKRNRQTKNKTSPVRQPPFRAVKNPLPPVNIVSDDEIEFIHQCSLEILRDIGIKVDDERALRLLKQAGAEVDNISQQVKFDTSLVEEMLTGLPSGFTIHARDPQKTLEVGGNNLTFATVCGPSFVSDLDRGRRAGTYEDVENFVKLAHSLNIYHHEGGAGLEPLDLSPESRHLDMMYAQLTLTDKAWHPCWLNSAARARDCIEMAKISMGVDDTGLAENPAFIAGINTNSPLLVDSSMCDGLIEMALAGQPVHATPFTLAGAMAPATLAGAITQQNAEVLACIVIAQAANRGCPVFYGHFTSNVDMRSGSPAFGTPEYAQSVLISAQLARRYNIPIRSSNTTASAAVDLQATYESDMSCWSNILGHVNVMMHAGGWLEGGLVCSFEKLILDAQILQMLSAFLDPVIINREEIGIDAIKEVGAGGHFFSSEHTLARYKTAFYEPMLSDWRNFETWQEAGAKTAEVRANDIWKQLLREYEKPPIDPAIEEALTAYIEKRKIEIKKKPDQ